MSIREQLREPLARKDIEFRVSRVSAKTKKASVLAYLTARGVMNRLDDVFGIDGWADEYELLSTGVKCKLLVRIGADWIKKEDVAPFTNIEALKGGFSDALKRAAVKYGIGRYLYELPDYWVDILPNKPAKAKNRVHYQPSGKDGVTGYWVEPDLPDWALPGNKQPDANSEEFPAVEQPEYDSYSSDEAEPVDELDWSKTTTDPPKKEEPKQEKPAGDVTDKQRKMIYAIGKKIMDEGLGSETSIKQAIFERYDVEKSTELTKSQASDFIEFLQKVQAGEIGMGAEDDS